MNKKVVRFVAVIMAFAMVAGIFAVGVSYVFADNEQKKIDESNQKIKEQQAKIKNLEKEQELTASDIERLKKDTVGIQSQIDSKNAEIAKTEDALEKAEKELEEAKKKTEEQYGAYKERFRIMCEEGATSYLEMIMSSDNLMDFVDNMEIAQEIIAYDQKMYEGLKNAEKEIETLTQEIASNKKKQEEERKTLAQQQSALKDKQSELEKVKSKLMSDEKAAQAIIDAEYEKQNELKAQMASKLSTTGDGSVYSGGEFLWPTPSCTYITSAFAPQRVNPVTGKLRPHTGTDIGAQYGATVIAAASGTVRYSGWNGGYGNCVIIDHGGGRSTLYAHMSSIAVSSGQSVSAGQTVGRVGSTGNSTGPHLHFEVLINGTAVNPMQYF